MDIIVLLKQVPATESFISLTDDGTAIDTGDIKWVINPYDEYAVEEALRMRETAGGSVTVLSAGPARCQEAVRTALAMGADKGIVISDPAAEQTDGLGVARILTAAIKDLPYDVIIAGHRAVDDDAYLVGTAVAEKLGIAAINMVVGVEVGDGRLTCRCTVEGGTVTLAADLPVLFTTQRGLNEPRYASLPGIMKAKRKPLETKRLADLGLTPEEIAPRCTVTGMRLPALERAGRMITGDSDAAKAAALVEALHAEKKVI